VTDGAGRPLRASRIALVVMGVSAVGKTAIGTAVAAALDAPFVEGDAFHPPQNVARMAAGIPLTDGDRYGWLLALAEVLRGARASGGSVVLSCSALRRAYRDLLRSGDDQLRFAYLDADIDVLRARMSARQGHFMPVSLLESQLATLEPPTADEAVWHIDANRSRDEATMAILAHVSAKVLP
jgi:gluconokinase